MGSVAVGAAPARTEQLVAPDHPAALRPLVAVPGMTPPAIPATARRLAALSAATPLDIDVTLRIPDQAKLDAFIAGLSDRSSPFFRHFLRAGQFGTMFGPPLSEVATVESVLAREGLRVTSVASDRLAFSIRADAGAVESAFHVSLGRFRFASGHVAFANISAPEVPESVAHDIQGVVGLEDISGAHSLLARWSAGQARPVQRGRGSREGVSVAGPVPCTAALDAADNYGVYTADQIAALYGMTPLYSLGDYGQGVDIALAEFEPDSASDIATYQSCYHLDQSIRYQPVDETTVDKTHTGTGEATLDIEGVMALAPDAALDIYQAPNSNGQELYDVYSKIVNQDADQVVTTSWGLCEPDTAVQDQGLMASEASLFAQAAAQGQSFIAASGDSGSTDCYGDQGTNHGSTLAVDDPASQRYVVGVGGTSIGQSSETVWNDSAGAGGGGLSEEWCMPSYQYQPAVPGLIDSSFLPADPALCGTQFPYTREVPDVSADADPNTGYTIYYSGAGTGVSGWGPIGGTSAAAPVWAAVAALIDASPFCAFYGSDNGGDPGVLPEGLYQVAAVDAPYIYGSTPEGLQDVTKGDNAFAPSGYTGSLYPATTGYDMASGLGTPLVSGYDSSGIASNFYPGLAALMCWHYASQLISDSITSVSPDVVPTTGSTTVTISGKGFLPIPGAELVYVGSTAVTPSCSSTTTCTAVLPPSPAGVVDLRMWVENLTETPAVPADRVTYSSAPLVHLTSPDVGYELSTRLKVSFSASDSVSPVASADLRYRVGSWNSRQLSGYVYPADWQHTTTRSHSLSGSAGHEYCFSARAVSRSGLSSAWSSEACTAIPLGVKSLSLLTPGWKRHSGAPYFLGSYLETSTMGAKLGLADVEPSDLVLVVTKCPSCGSIAVYVNGQLIRTVSTYSRTVGHERLVHLPAVPSRRSTLVLEDVSSGKRVIVEGVGTT